MKKGILGETIAKYRKEEGITQEELGRAVGVSTQAVSRWECGGTPDVELLPVIADRLHISVDALFGRDGGETVDLKELLHQKLLHVPKERCMEELLEYIGMMQQAVLLNHTPELRSMFELLPLQVMDRSAEEYPEQTPSRMIWNNEQGCMIYGTVKDRRFALVFPEPENGWASAMKETGEYVRLFTLLAKPHYLEMLIDMDMRESREHFTARLAATRLGISEEEAERILEELTEHMMAERLTVADEKGMLKIYRKGTETNLTVFLLFCEEMMHSSGTMYMNADIRTKPMLAEHPGTKSLAPKWNTRDGEREG